MGMKKSLFEYVMKKIDGGDAAAVKKVHGNLTKSEKEKARVYAQSVARKHRAGLKMGKKDYESRDVAAMSTQGSGKTKIKYGASDKIMADSDKKAKSAADTAKRDSGPQPKAKGAGSKNINIQYGDEVNLSSNAKIAQVKNISKAKVTTKIEVEKKKRAKAYLKKHDKSMFRGVGATVGVGAATRDAKANEAKTKVEAKAKTKNTTKPKDRFNKPTMRQMLESKGLKKVNREKELAGIDKVNAKKKFDKQGTIEPLLVGVEDFIGGGVVGSVGKKVATTVVKNVAKNASKVGTKLAGTTPLKRKMNPTQLRALIAKRHKQEKASMYKPKPQKLLPNPNKNSAFSKAQTKEKAELQRAGEAAQNAESYLDDKRLLKGSAAKNRTKSAFKGKSADQKRTLLKSHFSHITDMKKADQHYTSSKADGFKSLIKEKDKEHMAETVASIKRREKAPKLLISPKAKKKALMEELKKKLNSK